MKALAIFAAITMCVIGEHAQAVNQSCPGVLIEVSAPGGKTDAVLTQIGQDPIDKKYHVATNLYRQCKCPDHLWGHTLLQLIRVRVWRCCGNSELARTYLRATAVDDGGAIQAAEFLGLHDF